MPRVRGDGALLDSRMASELDDYPFFPSRLTIYDRAGWTGESASGDEVELEEGSKTPLDDHEDLHCQIAPLARPGVGETRRDSGVLEESSHLMLLPAAYPDILPEMVAVDQDGAIYDLIRCDIDPFSRWTRLEARQYFPAAIPGT